MTALTSDEGLYLDQVGMAINILLNAKDNDLKLVRQWVVKALLRRCDTEYRALIRNRLSIPDAHVPTGVELTRVAEVRRLLMRLEPVKIEITCGDFTGRIEFSV